MAADGSVVIEILGDAKDITSKLQSVSSGAVSGLKSAFSAVGTAVTATTAAVGAASAAVGGFAASSVKVGMDFDKSMSQVAATMGKTTDEIQDLRDFAMEMGATTAFSATQAADALNYMALAGYDSEKSMEMLPNVLNLAAAGDIDLARASDMVTDAASALGLSMEETTELVDKMAQASSKSNTSVAQLGDAILTVGGTAKNLAGGTTELSTALGILADNGVKGAEGGTALRNIILSLSAPTDKAAKAMQSLGVNAYDADGNLRPLNETFSDLNAALSTMTQGEQTEVLNTLFNKVDLKSVNALLANTASGMDDIGAALEKSGVDWEKYSDKAWAAGGSLDTLIEELKYNISEIGTSAEDLQEYLQFEYELDAEDAKAVIDSLGSRWDELAGYIDNAKGAAEQMAQTQLDNLAGDVTMFKSALEGVQLLIAGDLSGGLREFVQMGTEGLTKMSEALKTDGLSGAISVLADTLAQMATQVAEQIPAFVSVGAELLTSIITGLVSALPELAAQAPTIVQSVAEAFSASAPDLISAGEQLVSVLADGITQGIPQLASQIPSAISGISDFVTSALPGFLTKGVELAGALVDGILQSIPEIGSSLVSAASEIGASLSAGFTALRPDIMASGMQLLSMLVDGISQGVPQLTAQLPEIISGIGEAISSGLSALTDVGIVMVTSLVEGFASSIPDLVSAGLDALENISSSLLSNSGKLADAGTSLIKKLADGLIKSIPVLIQKAPTIISNLANIINQNAPKLLACGVELIGQLAVGLIQAIPTLVSNIPQIIQAIVDVIQAFQWINLGKTIIDGLVSGISNMVSSVSSAAGNVLSNITSALQSLPSKLLYIGKNGISGLINGVKSMISSIPSATSSIISKITGAFSNLPGEMLQIGKNLIQGLWNGISNMSAWIGQKIKGFGQNVLNDLKKFFGIKSPSTLMRDQVGKYIGEGIAVGIEESADTVRKSTDKIGEYISGGLADGMRNGTSVAVAAAEDMVWAVKDYVVSKDAFDEHSNSKWSTQVGEYVGGGLADGLKNSTAGAVDAAKYMVDEISGEIFYTTEQANKKFEAAMKELRAAYVAGEVEQEEYSKRQDELKEQLTKDINAEKDAIKAKENMISTLGDEVKALEKQIDTADRYEKNLERMAARNVPEEIANQLESMTVENAEDLQNLVRMTDEELEQYAGLLRKKAELEEQLGVDSGDTGVSQYSKMKDDLEEKTRLQNLSLQEQYAGWKEIQDKFQSDREKYAESEEQLMDLREQIQEEYYNKVKDTLESITSLEENYQKELSSRIQEIEKEYGLFSKVQDRETVSGSTLTQNLKDQIAALEEFYNNLDALAERGAPDELVEQIRNMGVDALDELAALVSMSDDELDQYTELFQEKHRLAVEQATKELEPLREETDAKIMEQLQSAADLYDQNVGLVGEAFTDGLAESIRNGMPDVIQAAQDVVQESVRAAMSAANFGGIGIESSISNQLKKAVDASAANLSADLELSVNNEVTYRRQTQRGTIGPLADPSYGWRQGNNEEVAFVVDGQKLATVMLPYNRAADAANPVVKDDK